MANIIVKVTGGVVKEINAATVADVKAQLNLKDYTAAVNKEPKSDSHGLVDGDVVVLTSSVKGAVILRKKV